ncbi:MAG: NAD(P)-binding protein [archaeon GB-1845-036]|nr:NAD(P)-binding protein [Candidatus Culexmicrobium thermophilum]
MKCSFLIVGAGLAGIFTAYKLYKMGYDVVLVEKNSQVGGLLRTMRYVDSKGNVYLFDIGPHLPPRNKIWENLCREVENVRLPYTSLKHRLKLGNHDILFPISLKEATNIPFRLSLRLLKSYLESLMVGRNEVNVEDCLINKFGVTFYRDYLRDYIYRFWRLPVHFISKDFDIRIPSISLKNLIRSLKPVHVPRTARTNSPNNILYPMYGVGEVVKPMVNKLMDNSEVKLNTIVKQISPSSSKLLVRLKEPSSTTEYSFDSIIWTGSLFDITRLLGLTSYRKLSYRKLLIVNCAVEREDLLGEDIVDSYIMSPEIIFHRVYEPKKFSPKMAPPSRSSVCIEITIAGHMEKMVPYLIEKSIKQLQRLYNLASSEVRYLGYEIIENAYPVLFVNYKSQVNEITSNLQKKNMYLIGRTGRYQYIGIQNVLEEVVQFLQMLSGNRSNLL